MRPHFFPRKTILFVPLAALLLSACASSRGFHRDELRKSMNQEQEIDDSDIAQALTLKPQLPHPFTIGVYFQEPEPFAKWSWTEADREKILEGAKKAFKSGEVSKIFPILPSTTNGQDLKSIRLAAARHGADALLLVSGKQDTDSYNNKWGWTYFALVTALFVPGSEMEVLFLTRASLWDVRNQYLYMTAVGESTKSQTRPAAFTDEHEALREAKAESVERLGSEISKLAAAFSEKKQESRTETAPRIVASKTKALNKTRIPPKSKRAISLPRSKSG